MRLFELQRVEVNRNGIVGGIFEIWGMVRQLSTRMENYQYIPASEYTEILEFASAMFLIDCRTCLERDAVVAIRKAAPGIGVQTALSRGTRRALARNSLGICRKLEAS